MGGISSAPAKRKQDTTCAQRRTLSNNSCSTELINLNVQSLKVVSQLSDINLLLKCYHIVHQFHKLNPDLDVDVIF